MNRIYDIFKDLFVDFSNFETENEIKRLQGEETYSVLETGFLNKFPEKLEKIKEMISVIVSAEDSRKLILKRKELDTLEEIKEFKNKAELAISDEQRNYFELRIKCNQEYLECLTWKHFFENNILNTAKIVKIDWELMLLSILYEWYKKDTFTPYIDVPNPCPLAEYYLGKGIDLDLNSNYGLVKLRLGWELKHLNGPKIFDPVNDTHILVRMVNPTLFKFLNEMPYKDFTLSLRPNYFICGDNIKDRTSILEALMTGQYFESTLSALPDLTRLYDEEKYDDQLIIIHNKERKEVSFEELVSDFDTDQDSIVTRMVHLGYKTENGVVCIHHIDYEYLFYDVETYSNKDSKPKLHGESRKRYKTFKIDDATIPWVSNPTENILYQSLITNFKNFNLIEEYFQQLLQK